MFYIEVDRKNLTIFFSQTQSPRALIFGRKHRLVNFYEVCSNYGSGVKIGPAQGGHMLYIEIYSKNFKKSSANLQFKPVESIQAPYGLLFLELFDKVLIYFPWKQLICNTKFMSKLKINSEKMLL